MKNLLLILFSASLFLLSCSEKKVPSEQNESKNATAEVKKEVSDVVVIQQQSEPDTLKGSLKAEAIGRIGSTEIKVAYHSPSVRGRIVWGGLVPFDRVWVTGAHMATSIEFNHDIEIGGKTIQAGKYAFFTIPGKDEWIVIINTNWQQHLADKYNEAEDVVRLKVKPEQEEKNQERLRYVIEENNGDGELVMYWEKVEVSVPFKIKD
jgi:Protein of unknown function (DUF2911)